MGESPILERIDALVDEEHHLWSESEEGRLDEEGRGRLEAIRGELDRCWGVLRPRRGNPDAPGEPPAVAALVWANASSSYESVWTTKLSIHIGGSGISQDLRDWVNNGLMTFFFLVVGLEAKRELDTGELRERRRLAIPVVAAIGGIAGAIAIFLTFNAGGSGAHGFGAAMSTDTAFALGALALIAPQGTRLRVFLLTLAVVDDLVALVIIATA